MEILERNTSYTFYIETDDKQAIISKLAGTNIKILFSDELKKSSKPNSLYIRVPLNEVGLFLERIKEENLKSKKIELYKLEETEDGMKYHLYTYINSEDLMFATTFFYQKLKNGEEFISKEILEGIEDSNYLDTVQITKREGNTIEGEYRSIGHMMNHNFTVNTDHGTFKVSSQYKNNQYVVTSEMRNIRKIIKNYPTPYDYLFAIPNKDGVSRITLEEYYALFMNVYFIHYAKDVDRIEVYDRGADGKLVPYSIRSFPKDYPMTDFEKSILNFIDYEPKLEKNLKR